MTQLTMTTCEAEELMGRPEILFLLADYHDFQQDHADSVGMGTMGDALRATELRDVACRIADEDADIWGADVLENCRKHKNRASPAA